MRVYVATAFVNWRAAYEAHQILEGVGCRVTSADWVEDAAALEGDDSEAPEYRREAAARGCLAAIDRSDALVLIEPAEGGVGCFVEVGYALAKGMPVYVVGDGRRTIFATLCSVVPDVSAAARLACRWQKASA